MTTLAPASAKDIDRREGDGSARGTVAIHGGTSGVAGRYRVLFGAGRGGMGTVEVALERGAAGSGRVVALKRLLPDGARNPRHKEMFLREAQLAARLTHPNVVHVFTFGELDGELFMAMEYVEGQPLSRLLSAAHELAAPLEPAVVAGILAEVCEGLHAAHELRDPVGRPLHVVHRDVSPQNVMVAYAGHSKVLDFGVAKFEMAAAGNQTRTGEVKGKMAYMSPEQALGEPLDRRSDLYSVGAVLFECLTGRRMWGTGTDLDVMRKLALEDAPRLDTLLAEAPPALVNLHARLVARDRAARPATAREVAAQLRSIAWGASGAEARHALTVTALMRRLFPAEEAARATELQGALDRVAPGRPVAKDDRFEPEAAMSERAWAPPVVTAPAGARGPGGTDAAPWKSRIAWLLALGLVASAAGLVRRPAPGDPGHREAAMAAIAAQPSPPTATQDTTPRATVSAPVPPPPASAQIAVAPIAPVAPRPAPRTTGTPVPGAGASGAPNARVTRLRPPDVDPSPF